MSYDLVEAEIKTGKHLCSFYENKVEQFQIVIPFLIRGLARNEKCLYIADENSVREVKAGILMHGIDVEEHLRSGQLSILTANETYLRPGKFVLDDMILQLESFVKGSEKENYSGTRISGELTWLIRNLNSLEEFLEYERTVDTLFRKRRVKILCQYNSKKFFGDVILGALKTHSRVLLGLDLYKNVYNERPKTPRRRMPKLLEGNSRSADRA